MRENVNGKERTARRILGRILLVAGVVSLTVCILFAVQVGRSYQSAVVKEDFAGFSLGLHFLLYGLMPLTLSLFVAACLFDPPAWLLRQLDMGAPSSKSFLRTVVVALFLVGAATIFLSVAVFVGGNLMSAVRHYGYGGRGLATILLQNLVLSAPLLILSVLLAWAARALHRRPTG